MGDHKSASLWRHQDDEYVYTREYAESLDKEDPLRQFKDQFIIPSKADLTRKTIVVPEGDTTPSPPCIYLCGNSLGLQPKSTRKYIDRFLQTWATKGVLGHFTPHSDEYTPQFLDVDDAASKLMAPVVGALVSEVAVMDTLTTNLHLLMASFYRPTKEKYKIILEGKAFPSDHFAVESQIQHHNLDPKDTMILIEPDDPSNPIFPTEKILKTIDTHASSTALILLPAIQFYTGQYFDIREITAHAHSKGVLIGWDCAHAVGNVDLQLHDWNVDFAAWCNYKYVNSGPGAMAGLFVHERHGVVDMDDQESPYRPRLSGWWGGDKGTRFLMDNKFVPRPGAAGFQISNPSVLDISAVISSLEIFSKATMPALRRKSIELTGFLEHLLLTTPSPSTTTTTTAVTDSSSTAAGSSSHHHPHHRRPFSIITPSNPSERGAQLSLRLEPGLLDGVLERLEAGGIVIDERKPDVVRVASCPLYNSFSDVWEFCRVFLGACEEVGGEREREKR
ncbi:kynureninase [Polytolypa hystricis UAMH7299]|uniref:Kynureninase n=1 Tax=Polytolypa hystricis (strain UAMH7299) TaxID=1447883 RepID=A0A2B7YK26_POLH7|nr:kynureninase [Polytolypa hystricis UAMH7299]